jgi:release factor glutamine methyltransferase
VDSMDRIPDFYPDSDDTYLLIDAITNDHNLHSDLDTSFIRCAEIGSGGGLVSKSVVKLMESKGFHVVHLAIDVNRMAAEQTKHQCKELQCCEVITADVFSGLRAFQLDIIFCNPPYVPSSPIMRARDIRASYAGGERGREFIDGIFPQVSSRLAPNGVFYLLLERRNDIAEVLDTAARLYNLRGIFLRDRKIRGEHLFVYRFSHMK